MKWMTPCCYSHKVANNPLEKALPNMIYTIHRDKALLEPVVKIIVIRSTNLPFVNASSQGG